MFFFEKKAPKNFDSLGLALSGWSEHQFAEVFCFFFSKKKSFLPVVFAEPEARRYLNRP
jgi:hypothetical protein